MTDDDERKAARELVRWARKHAAADPPGKGFAEMIGELCDELEAALKREGEARAAPKDRAEALDRALALVPAMASLEDAERHAVNIADALAQARAEGRREVLEALEHQCNSVDEIHWSGTFKTRAEVLRDLRRRFAMPEPRGDGGAQ